MVFPAAKLVLCLWHINKNILARCKRHFRSDDDWIQFFGTWAVLLQMATLESYSEALGHLRARYERFLALDYVEKTWFPYKEDLVRAWTDRALHLDISTTSRVEGSYSALKRYLQVTTGNFHAVAERVGLSLANRANEARAAKARAHTQIGEDLRNPLCVNLLGIASPIALRKLIYHRRLVTRKPLAIADPCTGLFRVTTGLPCAHELCDRVRLLGSLGPRVLYSYWLFNPLQALGDAIDPIILFRDPQVAVPRGRPRAP